MNHLTHFASITICGLLISAVPACAQSSPPKLLPFQGRLTDATGKLIPDGVRLVQFQIFDAPSGGNVLWTGETHRTTVNGGLINVILGTKTPLDRVDFNRTLYLEMVVGAEGAAQISPNDPPLLPRQAILPVVFASESAVSRDSQKLAGYDWTAIFGTNNPSGKIDGARIINITSNSISPGTINDSLIASNAVTLPKMARRETGPNAPVGGIAISSPVTFSTNSQTSGLVDVPGLSVTLVTSGRPVVVTLVPAPPVQPFLNPLTPVGEASYIGVENQPNWASLVACAFAIVRNGTNLLSMDRVSSELYSGATQGAIGKAHVPAGSLKALDLDAGSGTNRYSIKVNSGDSRVSAVLRHVRLVAYEL